MTDGLKHNYSGLTEEEFLAAYDASEYERPSVTVDMLLFTVMDQLQQNYRKLPEKSLQLLFDPKRGASLYRTMGVARWFCKYR